MYRDFFGLTHSPFNNTPDPRFFFNTPDHEEAVASLIYAAQERKGFALVTGEVGSGKTLVSRLVLSRLERSAKFAVVHNTRVGPRELLFSICREFDVRVAPDAAAPEMSRALEEFLLDQYARDRLAVVIVDEAQHLTAESFEELRLLGNLEADDAKLMSVLILGQPELQETFRMTEMRQLQQRLFRSFHLKALTRELTEGYISHRLRVAGFPKGQSVFDRPALDAVFNVSGGIPRLINQICDSAMLAAYTRSTKKITEAIVAEVTEQSRPSVSPSRTTASFKMQPTVQETTQRIVVETRYAEEAVRLLEDRVREVEERSQRSRKSVEESLARVKTEFADSLKDFVEDAAAKRSLIGSASSDVQTAKHDLAALVHEQRRQLDALRASIEETSKQAFGQAAAFKKEVEQINSTVIANAQAERKELESRINEASRTGSEIESQSQAVTAQMTAAWRELQRTFQETMGDARETTVRIREQSDASLGQLRESIAQINERASAVRQDLVELGEQVKQGSFRSVEGLKQIVVGLLHQIEERRGVFSTDIDQACVRMGQFEKRFGEGVVAAKTSVHQIVEDARSRFEVTQVQAREMLSQAQAAAATTNEQGMETLAEARAFADRLRERAEVTVRRADATAETTIRELQELRGDLRKDREQVREQILESKSMTENARQEAARFVDQARAEATRLIELANSTTTRLFEEAGRFERESQVRAERIIQHARETEGRVESLLRLPKDIIDEANARTASLAELSKSLSSVVAQLGSAGEAAKTQKLEITEASALAEERLEGLRSHTARVGQLVGIIRQLYGVMDARIEGLRGRLDQADELCRTVPQEIDGLRSALSGSRASHRSGIKIDAKSPSPAAAPPRRGKSAVVKSPEKGMLGDIVSRNRKLHEWLRQTLSEAKSQESGTVETRATREIAPATAVHSA